MDRQQLLNRARVKSRKRVALGDGESVLVRGLSYDEVKGLDGEPINQHVAEVLHWAMLEPVLTEDEAREWMAADGSAGDIAEVVKAVMGLSGATQGAPKEAYKSV
jgi:hypothetical protein